MVVTNRNQQNPTEIDRNQQRLNRQQTERFKECDEVCQKLNGDRHRDRQREIDRDNRDRQRVIETSRNQKGLTKTI